MKCARLQLQERSKPGSKTEKDISIEKPRRFCQKRMVNPEHEEDPRWKNVFERFRCHKENNLNNNYENTHEREIENLYLTVQTLNFNGAVEERKRPMTSFKYKTLNDNKKHRMFVKQVVQDEYEDIDRFSDLTNYYFDDYVKYLFSNDKSRPASGKSTLFLQELTNKCKENKGTQANITSDRNKTSKKCDSKNKNVDNNNSQLATEEKNITIEDTIKDSKIMFNKSGKRKSLTISRAQSPETIQIIRVDVICNNNSKLDEYECTTDSNIDVSRTDLGMIDIKNSHLATKYLLTNTIKTLDESLSGGAKVTLFCKTFKLTERSKILNGNKKTYIKNTNAFVKPQKRTNNKIKKVSKVHQINK